MKKFFLLFLPFLVLPMTLSCGNSNPPGPTSHTLEIINNHIDYGIVNPDVGRSTHNHGEKVTISVTEIKTDIATFADFYDADNNVVISTNTTCEITMDRDYRVEARWSIKKYNVTVVSEDTNKGTVKGSGEYMYDEYVTATATSTNEKRYLFAGWQKGDEIVSRDATYKFKCFDNVTITALWNDIKYHITVVSEDTNKGTVSGGGECLYGDNIKIEATPTSKTYTFAGWKNAGGQTITDNPYTFSCTGDDTFTAMWEYTKYKFKLSTNNSHGKAYFAEDKTEAWIVPAVKINIHAEVLTDGYKFDGWYVKGDSHCISTSPIYDYTMPEKDVELEAKFVKDKYTLTLVPSPIGAGGVSGGGKYEFDSQVIVEATTTSEKEYKFIGWWDGEEKVSEKAEYSFKMPSHNLELTAKWESNRRTLTLVSEDKNIIEITGGAGSHLPGDVVNVKAKLTNTKPNYLFDGWYDEENKLISDQIEFDYTMIDKNTTLTARWKGALDGMSWQEIAESDSLEIGAIKSVKLFDSKIHHAVRIIGKDHDSSTVTETKDLKYTFQFDQLVTNDLKGTPIFCEWNIDDNYNFYDSILYKRLNTDEGSIYKLLPPDLHDVIELTYKKFGVYDSETQEFEIAGENMYLFPISVVECNKNSESATSGEGTTYKYYNDTKITIMYPVNGNSNSYWLRSPSTVIESSTHKAFNITYNGALGESVVDCRYYLAPCFCVGKKS